MTEKESRYKSYMLRLWASKQSSGETMLRVQIQCVTTGEQHQFADLEALFFYLEGLEASGLSPEIIPYQSRKECC